MRSQDSSDSTVNPRIETSAQESSDNSRLGAISRIEPTSTTPLIAYPVPSRRLVRRAFSLRPMSLLEQVDEGSPGDGYRPEASLNAGGIYLQPHRPESNIDGSVHREPITLRTMSANQPTTSTQLPRFPRNPRSDSPSASATGARNSVGGEASGGGGDSSTTAGNQTIEAAASIETDGSRTRVN